MYTFHHVNQGCVYIMDDPDTSARLSYRNASRHPYMILSDNNKIRERGDIYCLSLTSAANRQYNYAVPVMNGNDVISYINTEKVYKFHYNEFELKHFKGQLCDDIIKKEAFIYMIKNLTMYNMFGESFANTTVIKTYNDYVKEFDEVYKNETRLKDVKRAKVVEVTNQHFIANKMESPKKGMTDRQLAEIVTFLSSNSKEECIKYMNTGDIRNVARWRYTALKYLKERGIENLVK